MSSKKAAMEKRKIPSYMTSFADMMTIVLTFFILLYSYSKERQVGMVRERVDSFVSSIESMGMPAFLTSTETSISLGKDKAKYSPYPGSDEPELNEKVVSHLPTVSGVDIEEFKRKQSARVSIPKPFNFGSVRLSAEQKEYILSQSIHTKLTNRSQVNIICYAGGELPSEEANMRLALSRAINVMSFLHKVGQVPIENMRPMARVGSMTSQKNGFIELTFEEF